MLDALEKIRYTNPYTKPKKTAPGPKSEGRFT